MKKKAFAYPLGAVLLILLIALLAGCQSGGQTANHDAPEEAVEDENADLTENDGGETPEEEPDAEINAASAKREKARTVITTDGEVDDRDSVIRALLYSNDMDIAGIVLTSSMYHYAGDEENNIEPFRWTGTQWIYDFLDAYEKVYNNLKSHDPEYPEPEYLKSVTRIGNIKNKGEMDEITDGSEFLKELFLDDDPRTLYVQTWGGTNTTARALKSIEEEYKDTDQWETIQEKINQKLVIYIILDQDESYGDYIAKNWPDLYIINDRSNFWHFAYAWQFHSDELNDTLKAEWCFPNLADEKGPLMDYYALMGDGKIIDGELDEEQRGTDDYLQNNPNYNRYDFISEGDSPSFFYLLDTGLRSMEDPSFGGWGGRFGQEGERLYKNTVVDYNPYSEQYEAQYTLSRWFTDIQNDFAARVDWSLTDDDSKVNHAPSVSVTEGIDITAAPGEEVVLTAVGEDPDGDKLSYHWWRYFEADSYQDTEFENKIIEDDSAGLLLDLTRELADDEPTNTIGITGADQARMSFTVPEDAQAGDTIHMIVEVQDDGKHNLKHYQRVIITVFPEEVPAWTKPNGTAEPAAKIDRSELPRIIITQDGEVDDNNSLVRTLLYANNLDIAGIIQTSSQFHYSGDGDKIEPYRWMGTDWMYDMLDAYDKVYNNLIKHDPNYPTAEDLKAITVIGNIKAEGEMDEVTEGSELIRACMLDDDPRILNIAVGGGANTTARALKSIEEEYKDTDQWDEIYQKICDKVILAAWGAQDNAYEIYISQVWPDIPMLDVSGASGPIGYTWGQTDIPMSALKKLEGSWMYENLDHNHGALLDFYVTWGDGTHLDGEGDSDQFGENENLVGSLDWWGGQWMGLIYNRYDFLSEGDSPDWIRAIDNNLRADENMTYGGWGGRYIPAKYEHNPDAVYYTSAPETSMADWMEAIQNDFAARADWCIESDYQDANHAPVVHIKQGLDFDAKPGDQIALSAVAGDPDGDFISYHWRQYAEADTYDGEYDGSLEISHVYNTPDRVLVTIPGDAKRGDTIHVILEVSDNGEPPLTAYQRAIINVK